MICDHEKKKNVVDLSTHNAIRGKKKMIVLGRSRKHLNTFAAVSAFKYKGVLTTNLIVIGLRNMEYVLIVLLVNFKMNIYIYTSQDVILVQPPLATFRQHSTPGCYTTA